MKHSGDHGKRGAFGSKFGIIAATAGSAVGLGNIWRFPYVAGENGGGAFLLIYLLMVLLIGLPVMLSELSIGRMTLKNPFGAFRSLKPGSKWFLIGLMGIASAFMINAFYCVVAGWTLEYLLKAITNQFQGKSPDEISGLYSGFQNNAWRPIMWSLVFIALTAGVVLAGVQKGIEKYSKILMPLLFLLIIVLGVRSMTLPNASQGLRFLFYPDFSKITTTSFLDALGQAFFSLSIGMGTLITYGSYIQKQDNLSTSALSVAIADTLVAILAGIAIFPAVFAFGISPASGPELVFLTLPNIFIKMSGGYVFAVIFFLILVIAALTSTISILEVVVVYFSEEFKISRRKATLLAAVGIALLSFLCSLSLYKIPALSLFGFNLFGLLEYTSSNILLPLGGLMIVIFTAWVLGSKRVKNELSSEGRFKVWFFKPLFVILRFLAPLAIALVFLYSIGILKS